jgi:hypothetical protein
MSAVCNLCPTSTKGIVWFKFVDKPWISYKPTTFPFAYETIDNGNGTWTLKFYRRPTIQPRRWIPRISWIHAETGNTFQANFLLFNGFVYGDANEPYIKIRMVNGAYASGAPNCNGRCVCDEYWVVDIKDKCGNIFTRDLLNPFTITAANSNTRIHQLNSSCQLNYRPADGGAKSASAPFISSQVLQPYNVTADTCGDCPSGWELENFIVTGQGNPQIQITCGADKCPPDSCECDCGAEVCCWNGVTGTPIYSYLK